MEFAKKLLFTLGFCLAMLSAFAGKTSAISIISIEKSDLVFTDNSVHADDFLQPQSTNHLVAPSKSEQHFIVKFFCASAEFKTRSKSLNPVIVFYFQDINRCETVSLHLFPYHFFW